MTRDKRRERRHAPQTADDWSWWREQPEALERAERESL